MLMKSFYKKARIIFEKHDLNIKHKEYYNFT